MARRKQAREAAAEITVWPSSFPEDIGSLELSGSIDSDDRGSHFLTDPTEPSRTMHAQWEDEVDDEPYFDAKMGAEILRSFGLKPMPKRTTTRPLAKHATTRPLPPVTAPLPKLAQPRLPRDLVEMLPLMQDVDLTDETIREGSLLDSEGDELGEVRAPSLITEDVHTHGKRRGGHARSSMRPPVNRRDGE